MSAKSKTIGQVIPDDEGFITITRVDFGQTPTVRDGTRCVGLEDGWNGERTMTPTAARALAALLVVAAEDAER